jgi:hypothetical protein
VDSTGPTGPDPDDEEYVDGGMMIKRGNQSTLRKSALGSFCVPQTQYGLPRDCTHASGVRSRRLFE